MRAPSGPGVRDDNGYASGTTVSQFYDPMISKFIVHARDREQARARMLRCLDEYVVHGVETNVEFLKSCLEYPDFVDGSYDTGVVTGILDAHERRAPVSATTETLAVAAAAIARHLHASSASAAAPAPTARESAWTQFGRQRQVQRF